MKRACLLLIATCAVGCDAVSEKADEWTTVGIGAEQLSAVQIERSMMLGPEYLPACLDLSITLPSTNTTVAMQSANGGCSLSVTQPDQALFTADDLERARKEIGSFDVDGLRGGSVSLEKLELWNGDGSPLDLARYVDALSLSIDGQTLLDRTPTADLLSNAEVKHDLPDSLIAKLKTSVKTNQVATADVAVTLWLHGQTLTNLPGSLKLNAVLQPELEVNIVDAAL